MMMTKEGGDDNEFIAFSWTDDTFHRFSARLPQSQLSLYLLLYRERTRSFLFKIASSLLKSQQFQSMVLLPRYLKPLLLALLKPQPLPMCLVIDFMAKNAIIMAWNGYHFTPLMTMAQFICKELFYLPERLLIVLRRRDDDNDCWFIGERNLTLVMQLRQNKRNSTTWVGYNESFHEIITNTLISDWNFWSKFFKEF